MNLKDIDARIAAITAEDGDDESQHGLEDSLYMELLEAIKDGTCEDDPREMAARALTVGAIKFARWYA